MHPLPFLLRPIALTLPLHFPLMGLCCLPQSGTVTPKTLSCKDRSYRGVRNHKKTYGTDATPLLALLVPTHALSKSMQNPCEIVSPAVSSPVPACSNFFNLWLWMLWMGDSVLDVGFCWILLDFFTFFASLFAFQHLSTTVSHCIRHDLLCNEVTARPSTAGGLVWASTTQGEEVSSKS